MQQHRSPDAETRRNKKKEEESWMVGMGRRKVKLASRNKIRDARAGPTKKTS